jgi:hypothetical protein
MAFGSFDIRTVFATAGAHSGSATYYAHSNSDTTGATAAISQSYVFIPDCTSIDCWAWVAASRAAGTGTTRVSVLVDDAQCGSTAEMQGMNGWTRVGGRVVVTGDSHTFVVVAMSYDGPGDEGWSVWVDDVGLEVWC